MAFCDWCRLETESEESCEWCRRPIRRNYNIYAYRDSVSLLREDGEERGDRLTTIFGGLIGVAFVALIGFAVMNARGGAKGTDQLSQIAASEMTWTAQHTAQPASASAPLPSVPAASRPTQSAPRPIARAPQLASSSAPRLSTGIAISSPAMLADGDFSGVAPSSGLILEQAELSVVRTKDGHLAVTGQVRITNVTGGRLSDISIKLVAGAHDVLLDLGGQDTDLGSGSARTFSVRAVGVPEGVQTDANPHLEVEAIGVDGPYKVRIALH